MPMKGTFSPCKLPDPFEKYKAWKKRGFVNKEQYKLVLLAHKAGFDIDIRVNHLAFPASKKESMFVNTELIISKVIENPITEKQVKVIKNENMR